VAAQDADAVAEALKHVSDDVLSSLCLTAIQDLITCNLITFHLSDAGAPDTAHKGRCACEVAASAGGGDVIVVIRHFCAVRCRRCLVL
jgi:hypothetical protein